jgi:hypothetical protein
MYFKPNDIEANYRHYRSGKYSKSNLSWGYMPAHTTMFIKKYFYDRLQPYDVSYKIAGDFEFLCRLIKEHDVSIKYIPEVLVRMQIGGASTPTIKNLITLNYEVLRACKQNNIQTNIFKILSKYPSKLMELIY